MPKAHVINIGEKYGRLEVVGILPFEKSHKPRIQCKCSCGKETVVKALRLKNGGTRSCGCVRQEKAREKGKKRFVNLVGRKFGKLTVLEHIPTSSPPEYKFSCECGETGITSGVSLTTENTSSCGCSRTLSIQETSEKRQVAMNRNPYIYKRIRGIESKAVRKSRTIAWELSDEEAAVLIQKPCSYCGTLQIEEGSKRHFHSHYGQKRWVVPTNGIDRVDSSKDYTVDNTVSCCRMCNTMKWSASVEDFKSQVLRIHNFLGLNKATKTAKVKG